MFVATLAGLAAGVIHVLSGPDHLAAIAPFAGDGRRRAWWSGTLWGIGHATGVAVVGVVALWFRSWLPVEAISAWSERIVGAVLVCIGLWGLRRALRHRVHDHPHSHGSVHHAHVHIHLEPERRMHTHAAFGVGLLHGLAGSSHLFAVLPALALPTLQTSGGYLGGYGAGAVVGMTIFAAVMGLFGASAARRGPEAGRWLLSACSSCALIVGIAWLGL